MRAKYVLSEVMVGLWRNVTMTVAMIITMAVSLTMLGASLVMYHQVDDMKARFLSNVQVSIFLDVNVGQDQISALSQQLDTDPLVAGKPIFLNTADSYKLFLEQMKNDPALVASTTPEQVPQSFRVRLKDPSKFEQIKATYQNKPGVDNVIDQASLLNRVFSVLGALQGLALVLAIAQGLAALLL